MAKSINERFVVGGESPIVNAGDKLFDYSAARNYSARMASNDVVSMPDCDEQYTHLNIDVIEQAIDEGYQQMEFHFIFSHYPNGQPAVQFRQCKMYDRRIMHWTGIVHEVLAGAAKRTYFPPEILLLEHFQAPQTHRSRYLPGLALDCYLNQDNDRNSHYLARELLWNGHPRSAIKEFQRHIAMNRWQQERGQSMIFIGDAQMMLGQEDQALDAYHRAFLIDDTRREPLMRLADHFYKKNNPQRVICYCMAALEIPPNDCYCNVAADYTFGPHEKLYWAYWWAGNRERSKEHWLKAFNYDPNNPKYLADRQFYEPQGYAYQLPGGGSAAEGDGIQGWMTHGELDWLYRTAQKAGSILELGSWKGRSSHALLSGCKGKVTCVDTWQGSEDVHDYTNKHFWEGKEDIYSQFLKNVGHFPNLEAMRMKGEDAAAKFRAEGRKFDMVFIDAEHTYESVKRDIACWRDLATVVISGHDYRPDTWMGVCQAVDEAFGKTYKAESIWYTPAEQMPAGYLNTLEQPERLQGRYPESIREWQQKIESGEPFVYVKYGDGEQQCMEAVEGATIDGQSYSFEIDLALRKSYNFLFTLPNLYMAFWRDPKSEVDGGILLHQNPGTRKDLKPLHDFYKAIRDSSKTKVLVGPPKLRRAAEMLKANFIEVPEKDAFSKRDEIMGKLRLNPVNGGIYLFSCGLLAKVLITDLVRLDPTITCLDTGSSFDPIFGPQTRSQQGDQKELLSLYADLISSTERIPRRIFSIWLNDEPGLPPIVEKCLTSQKVEGYTHTVLTLDGCPKGIPYLDAAIAARKWVKAADYLRFHELVQRGGIYMDSDFEVLPGKTFDSILGNSLFVCREENGFVANSIVGAEPGHYILKAHLQEAEAKFKGDDDKVFESSQEIITPRVYNAAAADPSIRVLPADWFIPYNHQTGVINVTDSTLTFHHFVKAWVPDGRHPDLLPRVAILIPSLGRPQGLQRCLDSIDRLYYPKHLIKTVVDEEESGTVPQKVNRMMAANQDVDIYAYSANDMEFTPWCLYRAVKASSYYPGGLDLVALNAGPVYPDEGNICEHFLIVKALADQLGEIFSEKVKHVGCDNILWAKAKKSGKAGRCEEAQVIHHHFSKGEAMDWVYQKGWSKVDEDRAILAEELKKLKEEPEPPTGREL